MPFRLTITQLHWLPAEDRPLDRELFMGDDGGEPGPDMLATVKSDGYRSPLRSRFGIDEIVDLALAGAALYQLGTFSISIAGTFPGTYPRDHDAPKRDRFRKVSSA